MRKVDDANALRGRKLRGKVAQRRTLENLNEALIY